MNNDKSQTTLGLYTRPILSFLITAFGLIYLLLVVLGQIDQQSKRFQIPEVIIFTGILLLNSENWQRLSKLQVGKEGFSFELNELKQGQDKIKQNQEKIQETQQEQRENIAELRSTFEKFLDNNQPLVAMIKRASEVSITDKFFPEKYPSQVSKNASETPENASKMPEDTSNRASSTVLSSLFKFAETHPDLLDSLVTRMRKEEQFPDDKTQSDQE